MSDPTTRAQQERRTRHARQGLVVAGTAGALATAVVLGVTTTTSEAATDTTSTTTSGTTTAPDSASQDSTSQGSSSQGSTLVAPGSGGSSHGSTGGS